MLNAPNTTFLLLFFLKVPFIFNKQHENPGIVMKSIKGIIFFEGLTAIFLVVSTSGLMAQNAPTDPADAKVKTARQISWNVLRLVGGLADNFSTFRGDSVSTIDKGVVCYQVRGIKDMNADHEYIMKPPGGKCYYIAYISGDEAKLQLYEVAFALGLYTFDVNQDHSLAANKDITLSTSNKEVYNLTLKGTKVGSFSWDKVAGNVYIIIGFIK
jgi:hypothetical protein